MTVSDIHNILHTKTDARTSCVSVAHKDKTQSYHVSSSPKWAKISGNWNVKFGLSVSPNGAFYIRRHDKAQS